MADWRLGGRVRPPPPERSVGVLAVLGIDRGGGRCVTARHLSLMVAVVADRGVVVARRSKHRPHRRGGGHA